MVFYHTEVFDMKYNGKVRKGEVFPKFSNIFCSGKNNPRICLSTSFIAVQTVVPLSPPFLPQLSHGETPEMHKFTFFLVGFSILRQIRSFETPIIRDCCMSFWPFVGGFWPGSLVFQTQSLLFFMHYGEYWEPNSIMWVVLLSAQSFPLTIPFSPLSDSQDKKMKYPQCWLY